MKADFAINVNDMEVHRSLDNAPVETLFARLKMCRFTIGKNSGEICSLDT